MIKAVIFDLYGTLVPGGAREERDKVAMEAAAQMGVGPVAFADLVSASYEDRLRGRLGDLHQTFATLARRLGGDPTDDDVQKAVALRLDMTRRFLCSCWALDLLRQIRGLGYKVGVVTDCSAETAVLWPGSPLAEWVDAVSFSCELGYRKPAPQMYLAVTGSLNLSPGDCLYVGDGASDELAGAAAVGMRAIWYNDLGRDTGERPGRLINWDGEQVNQLSDVLALLHDDAGALTA